MENKPRCPLIGADSNIYNLIGLVQRTLKENGFDKESKKVFDRVRNEAADYNEALCILMEYVEPVSKEEMEEYEL